MADQRLKYVARIHNVQEISLTGTADLAFWTRHIAVEDLQPLAEGGQAKLIISAAQGRFQGIRFRELTFSLAVVHSAHGVNTEGLFLIYAFNSIRFFAWAERTIFSCPYYPGNVRVSLGTPIEMALSQGGQRSFSARCALTVPIESRGEDGWHGPIFIPSKAAARFFYGRVSGVTEVRSFVAEDAFEITRHSASPIFTWLRESGFHPLQWNLRRSATHAKSETLARAACTPQLLSGERDNYLVR